MSFNYYFIRKNCVIFTDTAVDVRRGLFYQKRQYIEYKNVVSAKFLPWLGVIVHEDNLDIEYYESGKLRTLNVRLGKTPDKIERLFKWLTDKDIAVIDKRDR